MAPEKTQDVTEALRELLCAQGVSCFGFADLRRLPSDKRGGYPFGVAFGLTWDTDVLLGIEAGPTPAYHDNYNSLNARLDELSLLVEGYLESRGFKAYANTRERVGMGGDEYVTRLPHKTVATLAGLGWIGKSALLITEEFGSGLRISSVLTNAPLTAGTPIIEGRCGDCDVCRDLCPGGAIAGRPWSPALERSEFLDAQACARTAQRRSLATIGQKVTLCGLCVLSCPWTQRYLTSK
jgi:epoxyqueuosine reductase QueG